MKMKIRKYSESNKTENTASPAQGVVKPVFRGQYTALSVNRRQLGLIANELNLHLKELQKE